MIVVTVNGERIPLQRDEDEDFYDFVRRASPEEIIAILGRVIQLVYNAGGDDADVQSAVNDIGEQIGVLRGEIVTH